MHVADYRTKVTEVSLGNRIIVAIGIVEDGLSTEFNFGVSAIQKLKCSINESHGFTYNILFAFCSLQR